MPLVGMSRFVLAVTFNGPSRPVLPEVKLVWAGVLGARLRMSRRKRRGDAETRRRGERARIPKGLHKSAQACDLPRRSQAKAEERATLGGDVKHETTLKGLRPRGRRFLFPHCSSH